MKKNENATKKNAKMKNAKGKVNPKTKQSNAKKIVETSEKSVSAIETNSEIAYPGITKPVFALMRETSNLAVFEAERVLDELGQDFSQTQLDQMMSGELVLPVKEFLYSSDKAKLEKIIVDKGWNKQVAETLHENGTFESDTEPPQDHEIEYDADAEPLHTDEFGGEDYDRASEIRETEIAEAMADAADDDEHMKENHDDELDLSDPNQPIYDLYSSDKSFADILNKKETALIENMRDGKKVEASLSDSEKKILNLFRYKFEVYNKKQEKSATDENGQEPLDKFRTPERSALDKANREDGLLAEADKPLTDEEVKSYDDLNDKMRQVKNAFDSAPLLMMEIAAEVRERKLYRQEFGSIQEWAEQKHGITREYAQSLAQLGDFRKVLATIGKDSLLIAGTVNSNKKWAEDTNKIARQLGIKPSQFDVMKPIIEAMSNVISVAATDADGNLNSVAPRIFSAANDMIPEIIHTGIIEIGGEQMKIEDALALGEDVLTETIQTQMVEAVAEGIKTQKERIIEYINNSKASRTKPHDSVEPSKPKENAYKGVVPSHSSICSVHPTTDKFTDNYIVNVFNAGFETACGCKFQKLTTSGDSFVCIECEGQIVEH